MPLKIISQLMKPRHLRSLIFALIVFTAILALYQLFLGNASRPVPTQFGPLEGDTSNFVLTGEKFTPDLENEETVAPGHDSSQLTKDTFNMSISYENDRKAGKCLKVQSFKPDFDALEVYPTLDFDVRHLFYFMKHLHTCKSNISHSGHY